MGVTALESSRKENELRPESTWRQESTLISIRGRYDPLLFLTTF
jgi:hypothetical protein